MADSDPAPKGEFRVDTASAVGTARRNVDLDDHLGHPRVQKPSSNTAEQVEVETANRDEVVALKDAELRELRAEVDALKNEIDRLRRTEG